ncbi:hypothetical protein GOP47_0001911 [Adiantum capillus-veneris]|uniref:Rhodanese domain-containing protein n=1 Tax=Adiantum capillus-veneris TaxID=13818 RepID=A0A9D4V9L2_ADICA|nr:hypothetical protein GOP47_0001911 [Adiantum capillus-veneris]
MAMAHSLGVLSASATRPHNALSHNTHSELASLKFSPLLSLSARSRSSCKRPFCLTKTVRSQDEAEQMKEMAAAEKRWRAQVREGKIQSISPKQAGYAAQLSDYRILDVRPSTERNKAWVKESIWIPLFDVDNGLGPETILKKFSNFTMGGWWSGAPLMKFNNQFLPQATEKISLDSKVIVLCQKGLRSLAACEQLYNAGYRNLFWLEGGLDAAKEGDLNREGPQPFKFAGIGGVSEFLGWTDEQRAVGAKEGWSYRAVFFGRLVGIVLLADALISMTTTASAILSLGAFNDLMEL